MIFLHSPENVKIFDGVDAYDSPTWLIQDHKIGYLYRDANEIMSETIVNLKPYTRYEIYIKPYTVVTEQSGGVTTTQYFTTLPASKFCRYRSINFLFLFL